ncbi:TniQ family protein [Acidiphilium iwatense]|uniref:TniQ family protein n=1 Tax=Acidiphilium iwatense TaxID=768198 RepID=A0ABS9DUF4_9PROT|nr:TniQ family protein [Acidiphilium iwatense]MCF3945785.1 TniQ family protein [Acidiphilium iwatense]
MPRSSPAPSLPRRSESKPSLSRQIYDAVAPQVQIQDDAALRAVAQTWFTTFDPAAQARIVDLLRQIATTGADPVIELRRNLTSWFGSRTEGALPRAPAILTEASGDRLALEPLAPAPRPTMWPQRPKLRGGELFSSWLWRTAIAAGIPPRRFVRDAVGETLEDIDRDIAPATLQRLATLSGHTADHLAAGLLIPGTVAQTPAAIGEEVLLRDGRFLLTRKGRDRLGRSRPVLQYCPRCLRAPGIPSFARAWRFAHAAVCVTHACRLHERCWNCDSAISILDQRNADPEVRCTTCHAALGQAPISNATAASPRQRALSTLLFYLATNIPDCERRCHLDPLARALGGSAAPVEFRARALAGLRASSWPVWFGTPAHSSHVENLRILAKGIEYRRLAAVATAQRRRARLQATMSDASECSSRQVATTASLIRRLSAGAEPR